MRDRRIRIAIAVSVWIAFGVVGWKLWGRAAMRAIRPPVVVEEPEGGPMPRSATRSSGCDHPAAAPSGELFALGGGGGRFVAYGPRAGRSGDPAPVVLVFHGIGDDAAHFAKWFGMHDHVGDAAMTVYPEADRSWDIQGATDVELVARIVAALEHRFCVDPSRIHAFGFSWGGKLVSRLACTPGSPIRSFGLGDASYHAGGGACPAADVFVTVRTHDEDERPEWGHDAARLWAKHGQCKGEKQPLAGAPSCAAWSGCADGKRVVVCEDTWVDPSWPKEWNHTVRPPSLDLAWSFFEGRLL